MKGSGSLWVSFESCWQRAAVPLLSLWNLIAQRQTWSLFFAWCFLWCWTCWPVLKWKKKRKMPIVSPRCSWLMYRKCAFLMLHSVSLLSSSSATFLCVPLLCVSWWEFRWSALKQMFFLQKKKKNQFHRRCKDVITLHTEYKPVSRLTIWFQLNYLYAPYFQGWGDRFEAYFLIRCSPTLAWSCCQLCHIFLLVEIWMSEHRHI